MSIRFSHPPIGGFVLSFSHQKTPLKDKHGRLVLNRAGLPIFHKTATTAYLKTDDHQLVAEATAHCHPKDQFVKELGRQQALRKLIAQLKALGYTGALQGALFTAYRDRAQPPAAVVRDVQFPLPLEFEETL